MGSQVKAICKCGVNKTILIGGGMMNFSFIEYFPCLCKDCEDVVQANLKENSIELLNPKEFEPDYKGSFTRKIPLSERKLKCPKCKGSNVIPYNDDQIIGSVGDREVINWSGKILTNGTYKCPKCNKMSLKFLPSFYMWD